MRHSLCVQKRTEYKKVLYGFDLNGFYLRID